MHSRLALQNRRNLKNAFSFMDQALSREEQKRTSWQGMVGHGNAIMPVGTEAGLLEVTRWAIDGRCVLGAARSFVVTEAARDKL